MSTFSLRLRKLRQDKKLIQKNVADMLGITESAYGYYEQGKREPSNDTLQKLADFFDVTVDYLLGKTSVTSEEAKELEEAPSAARPIIRSLARAKELDDEDFDIIAKQVEDIIAYAKKKKNPPKS